MPTLGSQDMVIGVCTIELHLAENQSLKGKRQIINSLKGKLRNRFNVSVAEVDNLDLWQRATLGVTMVSNNQGHVNQELDKMMDFIESSQYSMYLMEYSIEFV